MKSVSTVLKLAIVIASTLLFTNHSFASETVFYFSRHAEKADDGTRDPNLTADGIERSHKLAKLLEQETLKAVYATPFKRTQQTATPTAEQAGLTVQTYSPNFQESRALLKGLKEQGGVYLIVGHSNTTPALASMVYGKPLTILEDHQYDHLYKVILDEAGNASLEMLYTEPRTPKEQ